MAELAETWCEWAEMELRAENFDKAVSIMAKATQAPKKSTVDYFDENLSPQQRIHKSWKLWSFYVDLVESVSSLEETKKVYERIFELRIATPQTVVNYANLLEENKYFEDSFKVYERGLDLFRYPVAFELWNMYLTKAVDRKIGIERLRDLFEQAVGRMPAQVRQVPLPDVRKLGRRTWSCATRHAHLRARNSGGLRRGPIRDVRILHHEVSLKLWSHIRKTHLRARHRRLARPRGKGNVSQVRRDGATTWRDRSCPRYLRPRISILRSPDKRSVLAEVGGLRSSARKRRHFQGDASHQEKCPGSIQVCDIPTICTIASFANFSCSTDVNFIASQAIARSQQPQEGEQGGEGQDRADAMAELERQARAPVGFVAASSGPEGGNRPPPVDKAAAAATANPDAIDLDMDED